MGEERVCEDMVEMDKKIDNALLELEADKWHAGGESGGGCEGEPTTGDA